MGLLTSGVLAAIIFHVSWHEMIQAVSSSEILFALRLSLTTSVSALLCALVAGIPSAYVLARMDFHGKGVVETLLDLPLVIPPLVTGVGLLFFLEEKWLGGVLSQWGLRLVFTPWGAVLAQAFIASPVVIRSCRSAFEAIDRRYEQAAQSLGLSPWQVFLFVTLPMAKRGLLSGAVLGWARALGEFGATLMVAGATRFKTATLPISVYLSMSSGELGLALACSWLLLLAGVIFLLALKCIGRSRPDKQLGRWLGG
jgi:molybdate transport system permease protein